MLVHVAFPSQLSRLLAHSSMSKQRKPSVSVGMGGIDGCMSCVRCDYIYKQNSRQFLKICAGLLPLQANPSSSNSYPGSQLQMKLPIVLLQFWSHPPLSVSHSLMSERVFDSDISSVNNRSEDSYLGFQYIHKCVYALYTPQRP